MKALLVAMGMHGLGRKYPIDEPCTIGGMFETDNKAHAGFGCFSLQVTLENAQ